MKERKIGRRIRTNKKIWKNWTNEEKDKLEEVKKWRKTIILINYTNEGKDKMKELKERIKNNLKGLKRWRKW